MTGLVPVSLLPGSSVGFFFLGMLRGSHWICRDNMSSVLPVSVAVSIAASTISAHVSIMLSFVMFRGVCCVLCRIL